MGVKVLICLVALWAMMPVSFAAQGNAPFKIIVSFSILQDVVRNVVRDLATVDAIVGPNQDAHVYELTPADVEKIEAADIVFSAGFNFEPWLQKFVEGKPVARKVVEVSDGISPLYPKGSRLPDPHVWGDVRHVIYWVYRIRDALKYFDPKHAKDYQKNADSYVKELTKLHANLKSAFARIPKSRRVVITAHDAFSYLGRAYDIAVFAPQGISTDHEPSAREMAQLIKQIKRDKVRVIYVENIANSKLIQQIALEAGVKIGGTLYSDALSEQSGDAQTYIGLQRHNAALFLAGMK